MLVVAHPWANAGLTGAMLTHQFQVSAPAKAVCHNLGKQYLYTVKGARGAIPDPLFCLSGGMPLARLRLRHHTGGGVLKGMKALPQFPLAEPVTLCPGKASRY